MWVILEPDFGGDFDQQFGLVKLRQIIGNKAQ